MKYFKNIVNRAFLTLFFVSILSIGFCQTKEKIQFTKALNVNRELAVKELLSYWK